jgi:hypothetical protein
VASIARTCGVGATALTAPHILLLYSAMLVASSGTRCLAIGISPCDVGHDAPFAAFAVLLLGLAAFGRGCL